MSKSVEIDGESNKSDSDKSDVSVSRVKVSSEVKLGKKPNESEIETDMQNKLSTSKKDKSEVQEKSELRRSERIKQGPSISYEEYDLKYDLFMCAQSLICKIPNSFDEIKTLVDRVQWEQAINSEINSLLINKTWTLVKRPGNINIVDCKWVFNIKNDEFGNPSKYKARLVARGFSQKYLVDYNETFAPVARIASFRFVIAFANQFVLIIHHMDVKTAF